MPEESSKSEPLRVENSLDLLIVLLYAPGRSGREGEPIQGITRLQKLVFLLKQSQGPQFLVESAKELLYKPYKMGPFSEQVYRDLDVLTSLGLVKTRKLEYSITDDVDKDPSADDSQIEVSAEERIVESSQYELTEHGLLAGRDLFNELKPKDREGLVQFKTFFNSISLRQLLIFVYQKYPRFTTESTIRGKLGL